MARILYIEDETDIGRWVAQRLTAKRHDVTWLTSGECVEHYLQQSDIVILDVMLPGLDGFSLGRRIKKEKPDVPILMLSARTAVEDKLEGLSFAEDYVTKPFHPEELEARVEVLLRRFDKQTELLTVRHLTVNPKDLHITNRETGEEIRLTGKQYQIFRYFLRHLNQILTKEQLYEGVWEEPYMDGDKTLMVHIRHLREKLEKDPAKPAIIETIRGIGYRVRK
ncbi:DNA-binding response regulator, OmpR family, contains REC and winged-helix (wHTH) domain [Lentibacillus persicus]|uniref:DNA-binding response regulator, OmpR family, contains REC and winged-helix (WHTH) domain n=1 Tax=Lentibacillus persicus TaxID=640948 RepID=A0A1I1UGZ4_9BACI|nr:response regulator transcription factor [Lentibacillus persicus]SFD68888.1 DNA-binding response regulator, OmpR family, contains REC and winged-helix (wHTH) domain [Lentibacillus persicus]